jgi:hypothetical protein
LQIAAESIAASTSNRVSAALRSKAGKRKWSA